MDVFQHYFADGLVALYSSVDLSSVFFVLCIFQVFMEFSRIVGKNLKQEFYESIDRHSPRLLELFRSKRGNVGQLLTQISQQTNVSPYIFYTWLCFSQGLYKHHITMLLY